MFKLLLQGEILQRIVSLWQAPILQIQTGEQMPLKAAQIFWSVTTDSFSDKAERLLSKLSHRKYRGFIGQLIVKKRITHINAGLI